MLKAFGSRLTYANVVATGALFLALGGGAYALSGIPDRAGVFHGCVSNATGVLRVVKSASSCQKPRTVRRHGKRVRLPGELAVSWNQQGPRGLQGIQGVQGQQGGTGAPGQNATKLFAYISNGSTGTDAILEYGNGVTAVSRTGMGVYRVTFDRSVANCVVFAEPEFGDPLTHSASIPQLPSTTVLMNASLHHDQVEVHVDQPTGNTGQPNTAHVDSAFVIAAFC